MGQYATCEARGDPNAAVADGEALNESPQRASKVQGEKPVRHSVGKDDSIRLDSDRSNHFGPLLRFGS